MNEWLTKTLGRTTVVHPFRGIWSVMFRYPRMNLPATQSQVLHRPLLGPAGPRMVRQETKEVENRMSSSSSFGPVPSRLRRSEQGQEKEVSPEMSWLLLVAPTVTSVTAVLTPPLPYFFNFSLSLILWIILPLSQRLWTKYLWWTRHRAGCWTHSGEHCVSSTLLLGGQISTYQPHKQTWDH